jgi:hypothetical protein
MEEKLSVQGPSERVEKQQHGWPGSVLLDCEGERKDGPSQLPQSIEKGD